MARTRALRMLACSLLGFSLAACDLVVADGEERVLGNDGLVVGSLARPGGAASPAVQVLRGGSLVIQNASVQGGSALVSSLERMASPANAVFARSGRRIRIESGLIRGGELAFTRPLGLTRQGVPAIDALETDIEMVGGTIEGGPAAGFLPLDAPGQPVEGGGTGLSIIRGHLLITGGVIRQGRSFPPGQSGVARSLSTRDSTVDIRGGDFRDGNVLLHRSLSRITGGRFSTLEVLEASCTEISGGTLESLFISSRDARLFLFGTNFSAGSGLLRIPPQQLFRLTGVLASGAPLDITIDQREDPTIILAAPGERGCL